tara:strand:+ start:280 stop:414 length:135 start_codon:yes stop_codon:yes gene_type:complete
MSNPPFKKYSPRNNIIASAKEKWIVLDKDCNIPVISILYNETYD